jgi:hypothetical protein
VSGSESELSTNAVIGQLVGLVRSYGSLPRAIFALISLYLLNGIFSIFGVVAGSVLYVFDLIVGSLQVAQSLLIGAFGAVGVDLLGVFVALEGEIAGVVASAGPAGPVIAVGSTAVILFVGYRLAVSVLGELPVGSTIVDLLGLR